MFQGFKKRLYYLYFISLLLPELRLQTKRTTAPIYKKLTTLNPPIIYRQLTAARLGSAWLGSAWLGSAWLGSTWLGSAWLDSAWLDSAWLNSANNIRGV